MNARILKIEKPSDAYVDFATVELFRMLANREIHVGILTVPAGALKQVTGVDPVVDQVYDFTMTLRA